MTLAANDRTASRLAAFVNLLMPSLLVEVTERVETVAVHRPAI
jgi:hypothetical protein